MKKFSELELDSRLMIWLTVGIVAFAAATALVLIRQANVMQGQLEEMKGSGEQTDRLIILNTGQMANAAKTAAAAQIQANAAQNSVKAVQKQVQIARENFVKEQRPYVWHSFIQTWVPTAPNQQIAAKIWLADYGKTPAIRLITTNKIFYGKDALKQADEWFATGADKRLKELEKTEMIVPPGIPSIPVEGPIFIVAHTDGPISQDEIQYILGNNFALVIAARIKYFDLAGTPYWSDICFFRSIDNGGTTVSCHDHNEMH